MQIISVLRILSIPLCFLLFLKGFFPLKSISNGYSTKRIIPSSRKPVLGDPISATSTNSIPIPRLDSNSLNNSTFPPMYSRVVLMIIDALRDDFLHPELNFFPNTISRLRSGHGMAFSMQTHAPTVTLPRIKAITTGTIPGFIDVVLNFGSTALTQDNIVAQMKINRKKMVFYGDDTWINLFPKHFDDFDGTTSFFVTDFTEVDSNVTRHLPSQLEGHTDWDLMILHYLGLDHIGHISGPNSPLVRPKLAEMDGIVDKIYLAMEKWETDSNISSVLVICGDHGMSDQGGHGGSTPSEIFVPLIFLSPSINTKGYVNRGVVSQTDLCPTLAMLLGIPIPLNSLGKVIPDTLKGYDLVSKVSVLHQNAQLVLGVFRSFVQDFERESAHILFTTAMEEHRKWLVANKSISKAKWERTGERILDLYSQSLSVMAERVGKLSSQYDVYAMTTSITLLWLICISIFVSQLKKDLTLPPIALSKHLGVVISILGSAGLSHIIMCTGGVPSDLICGSSPLNVVVQLFIAGVLVLSVIHLASAYKTLLPWRQQIMRLMVGKSVVELFMLLVTAGHTFSLASSSFVEEEHQTSYFLSTSIHILLLGHLIVRFYKSQSVHFNQPKTIDCTPNVNVGQGFNEISGNVNIGCDFNESCDKESVSIENNLVTKDESDINEGVTSLCGDDCNCDHQLQDYPTSLMDDFRDISYSSDRHVFREDGNNQVVANADTDSVEHMIAVTPRNILHAFVSVLVIVVFLRVLRRWNQTGNKWLNVPDIGDWLVNPDHKPTLSLVVIFSLMIVGASRSINLPKLQAMCVNLSLLATYVSRAAGGALIFPDKRFITTNGVLEARTSYVFIGLTVVMSMLPFPVTKVDNGNLALSALQGGKNRMKSQTKKENISSPSSNQIEEKSLKDLFRVKSDVYSSLFFTLQDKRVCVINGIITAWLCFMCLVLRPHNIPVVAMVSIIEQMATTILIQAGLKPMPVLLYCLWMGQASFFFQGNSNSISTVDVSAGYVGVTQYNPFLIGSLMTLSTYSGSIFWMLSFVRTIFLMYPGETLTTRLKIKGVLQDSLNWLSLKIVFPLAVYCIITSTQRYHLFVWTVFSPKLLYLAMETLVLSGAASSFCGIYYLIT